MEELRSSKKEQIFKMRHTESRKNEKMHKKGNVIIEYYLAELSPMFT